MVNVKHSTHKLLLQSGSSIIGWSWDIPKFRPPFNNVKQRLRPHAEDTFGNLKLLFLAEAACNDEASLDLTLIGLCIVSWHDSEGVVVWDTG